MERKMLSDRALALLKKFYGYSSFRPLQADAIEAAATGCDSLVLMPTGGGKSVCFQIPALMSEGLTIVVSPLIALMKDQVEALLGNGIPAAALNSNQTEAENRTVMEEVFRGRVKLLYVSPERLLTEIERWSDNIRVSLIAIDEAHCISQWGHDFRPEYTQLGTLKERFPNIPIMALTATADRSTRDDIVSQLHLNSPKILISSFDRPNLSLRVISGMKKPDRMRVIRRVIDDNKGESGIIYCMTRKIAEQTTADLLKLGYNAVCYHAGMSAADRNNVQTAFINGNAEIVCATIAFGMGIDKSNIRWVIHNNIPSSVESYYQEIGRAGRDGLPAETIMFYNIQDVILRERFIDDSGQPALNAEKFKVLRNYASANVCRRRILLSYFNEEVNHDCGNCDVCLNPPERFDGTRLVQMALSAIVRTDGRAGVSMLVDILRGSARADLISKGYNHLKTYGVGRDVPYSHWIYYINQMYQLGLYEMHWSDNRRLEVTPYGRSVLFNGEKIQLAVYDSEKMAQSVGGKRQYANDADAKLLAAMKKVRNDMARRAGIPPHLMLSDPVLNAIARRKPMNYAQFREVEGIVEQKANRYWHPFVNMVRQSQGAYVLPPLPELRSRLAEALSGGMPSSDAGAQYGMSGRDVYREMALMIDKDEFTGNLNSICPRDSFMRILELNRSNSEARFRVLVRSEFPDGLELVALAMANAMLRHRTNNQTNPPK